MRYLAKTVVELPLDTDFPGIQLILSGQTKRDQSIAVRTLLEKYVRFLFRGSLLDVQKWTIKEVSDD